MKILFLSRWFPYPVNNGSKVRIYNLLRGLSQHHEVTLLSFADQTGGNPEAPEIRGLCSKILVVPWKEFNPGTIRARLGFFSVEPRSVVDTFSPEMAEAIAQELKEADYNLIIASQLQMAAYHPYFQDVPAWFEELEIGLFHDRAFSADGKVRWRQALTWFKYRAYLSQLLRAFRLCTVVSEAERQLIVHNFPRYRHRIEVIPNCIDVVEYSGVNAEKKENTLIFTGPFKYRVNYEAMRWFVGEVFPQVLREIPEATLVITGDHENLPLPSNRNVVLAGYVDDIKALIASSAVAIAPLKSGGGTRLKILEAMAIGTPVVATSKGAEGLDAQNEVHLLVTDDPKKYAAHVINLFHDEPLRQKLSVNAAKLVAEKYDWSKVKDKILGYVEGLSRKQALH
jgi:glycosyltransferase involved in cell wall biosynthesis